MELMLFSDPVRPSNFESNGASTSAVDVTTSGSGSSPGTVPIQRTQFYEVAFSKEHTIL